MLLEEFYKNLATFPKFEAEFPALSLFEARVEATPDGVLHGAPGCADSFEESERLVEMLNFKDLGKRQDDFCPVCILKAPTGGSRVNGVLRVIKELIELLHKCEELNPLEGNVADNLEILKGALERANANTVLWARHLKDIKRSILEVADAKYKTTLTRLRFTPSPEMLLPLTLEAARYAFKRSPKRASNPLTEVEAALQESAVQSMAKEMAEFEGWSLLYLPLSEEERSWRGSALLPFKRTLAPNFQVILEAAHLGRDVYLMPAAAALYALRFIEAKQVHQAVKEGYVGLNPNWEAAETAARLFAPDADVPYSDLVEAYRAAVAV